MHKRKREDEAIKNIRSSTERLNITNVLLFPILTSLETGTTTESNKATEESIEDEYLEELSIHTRGTCLPNL